MGMAANPNVCVVVMHTDRVHLPRQELPAMAIGAWLGPADRKRDRACAARPARSTIAPSTSTTLSERLSMPLHRSHTPKVMHAVRVHLPRREPPAMAIGAWLAPARRKHHRACAARPLRSTIAPSTSTTPSERLSMPLHRLHTPTTRGAAELVVRPKFYLNKSEIARPFFFLAVALFSYTNR